MNILTRAKAIEDGGKRYFTGIVCPHGHVCERYVSTMQCVECIKVQGASWRETHPVESEAIHAAWRRRNHEKVKAWKSESQKRNRGAANKRSRRYHAAHREQINARISAWQKANPAKNAARALRRRAAKLQRLPAWADHEAIGMVYQAAQVARVTWPDVDVHVDHVLPLRGRTVSGLHTHRNLQLLTGRANRSKSIHFEGVFL